MATGQEGKTAGAAGEAGIGSGHPGGTGAGVPNPAGGGKTGAKGPKKKKSGGAGPGKAKPRRRPAIPVTVDAGIRKEDLFALGLPVSDALRGLPEDIRKCTDAICGVAERTTLPEAAVSSGAPLPDQSVLAALTAKGMINRAAGQPGGAADPNQEKEGELLIGISKMDVCSRGRRLCADGVNLAADGRLFIGAKFTFIFDKLLDVYRDMLAGPQEERALAVQVFGKIDSIRFRLLKKVQDGAAAGHSNKKLVAANLAEQKDEAAFHRTVQLLDDGAKPDTDLLIQATRHANRIQQQYGIGLAPDRRGGTR